ncbi:unnamed protein product [Fraxinus pennsylvanica]|uniref:Uncharacterized protein n=1 Tax=Fraxinus pennsylvanica TaxID=56036 RepID=A0AAD2A8B8_9LAMI|nr:unnamed protein product [Fraxinus pennsylvanica]
MEVVPAGDEGPNFPLNTAVNLENHKDSSIRLVLVQGYTIIRRHRHVVTVNKRRPDVYVLVALIHRWYDCVVGNLLAVVGGVHVQFVVINADSGVAVAGVDGDLDCGGDDIGGGDDGPDEEDDKENDEDEDKEEGTAPPDELLPPFLVEGALFRHGLVAVVVVECGVWLKASPHHCHCARPLYIAQEFAGGGAHEEEDIESLRRRCSPVVAAASSLWCFSEAAVGAVLTRKMLERESPAMVLSRGDGGGKSICEGG